MEFLTLWDNTPDPQESVEDNFLRNEENKILNIAIDSLSEEERKVIMQRWYSNIPLIEPHLWAIHARAKRKIKKYLVNQKFFR